MLIAAICRNKGGKAIFSKEVGPTSASRLTKSASKQAANARATHCVQWETQLMCSAWHLSLEQNSHQVKKRVS
jgi:hypothetical protein